MTTVIGVRFRKAGKVYYFAPGELQIEKGIHVIVETARGVEYGTVIMGCTQVEDETVVQPLKQVIRIATKEDDEINANNRRKEEDAFKICLEKIAKHEVWVKELLKKYSDINAENIHAILQKEVGLVFVHVLEEAGVYKCTPKGREDFMRFVDSL